MSRIDQYARNALSLVGQSFVQRIAGMVTTIVLARVLGASGFGIFSAVTNTATSAYGMVRLGVDASIHVHAATPHAAAGERDEKGRMLGAGLMLLAVSGVAGGIACVVLNEWLAEKLFGEAALARWLPLAGILVLVQCLSQFCYATLVGLGRFGAYARTMIVSAVAGAAAASAACIVWGVVGALAATIAVQALTLAMLSRQARIALAAEHVRLAFGALRSHVAAHLRFGLPFYAAGLLAVPVTYLLQGLLSRTSGIEALGELRVIVAILSLISFVPTAAAAAMISMLARSSGERDSTFARDLQANLKFVWLFAILTAIAVFAVLPLLVNGLFGVQYAGAVQPASIALLSTVVSCVLAVAGNALFSRRRVSLIFFQTMIQMMVFGCVAAVLIPRAGLVGYYVGELSGALSAIAFFWFVTSGWRRRNAMESRWIVLASAVTLVVGVAVVASTPLLGLWGRFGLAMALLAATASVGIAFVLGKPERNVLARRLARLSPGGRAP